jgi:putative oxidoreductase
MIHSTSIAERLAFGRPVDPVRDETPVHVAQRPTTALVGRLLIAAIFILSGIAKLTDTAGAAGYMTQAGVPHAETLAIIAGIAEVAGGVALVFGFLTRLAAIGLVIYMAIITVVMHGFWNFEGAEHKMQMVQFMKNLAIIGGLMQVVAFGPSRYSVDKKIREPIQP